MEFTWFSASGLDVRAAREHESMFEWPCRGRGKCFGMSLRERGVCSKVATCWKLFDGPDDRVMIITAVCVCVSEQLVCGSLCVYFAFHLVCF